MSRSPSGRDSGHGHGHGFDHGHGPGAVSVLSPDDPADPTGPAGPAPGRPDRLLDGGRPAPAAGLRPGPRPARTRLVGFFPGLGSRAAYRDLGRTLLDCGTPEVQRIYHDAARVLGSPGRPESVLLVPQNLPRGRIAQQGFVGAAFLVHSLALEAYLRVAAERRGVPLEFAAYTGESFGVITSAVAAGSLSVSDGVAIGHAFTPLMLVAAEGEDRDDPVAREAARYLPQSVRSTGLVPEPFHVVGLRGDPDRLAHALDALAARFPTADVEVHKLYSWRQRNLYVSAAAKPAFDAFVGDLPAVEATELKDPTRFLAHSARMGEARRALARFVQARGIVFRPPRVPVVANDGSGLLTTADRIRDAVLATTDRVMASDATVRGVEALGPDAVVELGLGGRSVQLLGDNLLEATATGYAGGAHETDVFLRAVTLVAALRDRLDALRRPGHAMEAHDFQLLRSLFRLAEQSAFADDHLRRTVGRAIADAMLPAAHGAPALHRFLEVFQHTYNHRHSVDAGGGELVLRARLKKRTSGRPERLDQTYAELQVVGKAGESADRSSIHGEQSEVTVFHFDRLAGLDDAELASRLKAVHQAWPATRPDPDAVAAADRESPGGGRPDGGSADRIAYQCALWEVLRLRRPALFAQSDHYLEGGDPLGWSAALAAAGAAPLPDAAEAYAMYEQSARHEADPRDRAAGVRRAVERMTAALTDAAIPVISPAGVPLQSRRDLAAATREVFGAGGPVAGARAIRLGGDCRIVCLGSPLEPAQVDAGPFRTDVVRVDSPVGVWTRQVNPALDDMEERATLALTRENEQVLRHARSRRVLSSTVNAYVDVGEPIVGFGKGGSESMTIFLGRDGAGAADPADGPCRGRRPDPEPAANASSDPDKQCVVVRKILSEALIAARWDPRGEGVMMPPFVKARKQAEFLQALPEPVRRYFPAVHAVVERRVPVPPHRRCGGRSSHREVVYEMDYVRGQEVSRFVEDHCPPPVVVARLYEQILRLLHGRVHSVARRPAPGDTLEVSYFRKIEDRLALCRRTAPRTFAPALLDTERIVVDCVPYLNIPALLARFRSRPEYARVLEPRQHCLVMGDANTENIKLADTGPLLHAKRLVEAGAPQHAVDAALAAITPESVGIAFLDPRAIGFRSDGRDTRDDPMYDNKPWHNSVGHYDEIHYEQFALRMRTGRGRTPAVDVEFTAGNPYQRAYRVRDVTAAGGRVAPDAPRGIEDWFAPVMTAVYGLDDPDRPYPPDDPYWIVRFVFVMGTHFAAMPPFHFQAGLDGTLTDGHEAQRRPVALYCEGVKWLNWAWEMLEGVREEFLGVRVPRLPWR